MITDVTTSLIDARLEDLLASLDISHPELLEALRYSLLQGGKRLRPKMLLSLSGESGLDVACALEMIHNYSLIHDDLPALDNDAIRRGKPTLHKQFGEATALLTGDFLLTYAFEVVSKASLPSPLRASLTEILSRYSRIMVCGQTLDIASKDKEISWDEYQKIVVDKTSSLFMAALECGALISNRPLQEIDTWLHFGKLFGLLFQLKDDCEDKEVPFALQQLGSEKIEKMVELLTIHAKQLLQKLQPPSPFLKELL